MRNHIIEQINIIEREHHIKILFSCESGSRGWQFPSIDSDFDVRFIYIRPLSFYMSVSRQSDHLSFPIHDELDIYGWDLKKVMQLLMKSNTTPFEWLQSPIVYQEDPAFRETLWQMCPHFFSPRINALHYLGIAKGALDTMVNSDEIKIKKLFYVLRPLLAAKWCLERSEIAPMDIKPLMGLLPKGIKDMTKELIEFKSTSNESMVIRVDPDLKLYIEQELVNCREAAKNRQKNNFNVDVLNAFFLKTVNEYDN